jgi:hypothetical protein
MKIFTIISLIVFITLNSCSSSKKSKSDYFSTNTRDQYLKLKTHKRADWKYFDDYDKYSSLAETMAPLYHLGIVPFGVYGGAMRIPVFYYDPYDYYRDAALNALDQYNNPYNYVFRYYSWNAYYNPYYYSGVPGYLDIAYTNSVNIYQGNQYGYPANNSITSIHSGQIRNLNDVRNILNYEKRINNNGLSGSLNNNRFAINKNNSRSDMNKSVNNSRNTEVNNKFQPQPAMSFATPSFPNGNSGIGSGGNSGSGMSAPAPVSKVR